MLINGQSPTDACEYRERRKNHTKAIAAGAVHGCFAIVVQDITGDVSRERYYINELLDDAATYGERVLQAEFHRQKGDLLHRN